MTSAADFCFPTAAVTHSAGDTPAGKPGRHITHKSSKVVGNFMEYIYFKIKLESKSCQLPFIEDRLNSFSNQGFLGFTKLVLMTLCIQEKDFLPWKRGLHFIYTTLWHLVLKAKISIHLKSNNTVTLIYCM